MLDNLFWKCPDENNEERHGKMSVYKDNELWATVWLDLRKRLRSLSPRDSIIILTAYADNWLIDLLDQRLISNGSKKQWYTGPSFGYASRLSLAYSVGLLNDVSYKSLQHLGRIRNKFAHMPEADDFDNEKIRGIFLEHIELSKDLFEALEGELQEIISALPYQGDQQNLAHVNSVYFKYLMIVSFEVALLKTLKGIPRLDFLEWHSDDSRYNLDSSSSPSPSSNQE